jgi:predicted nucleotidyltransferase
MKHLEDIQLTPDQNQALQELRVRITAQFKVESMVIYGSTARGEADSESDIDLLVLTYEPLKRSERHLITNIAFETNLKYGTNFSTLVIDQDTWDNGIVSVLPIHTEILNEGVII